MRNIFCLTVLLCTLPTHQVESLGIDPDLRASWEIVSLQLVEVSQNGHFPQAFWKQKLCDLVSLSDTSDRREKSWCLSDWSGIVQMTLFMICSLKGKISSHEKPKPFT